MPKPASGEVASEAIVPELGAAGYYTYRESIAAAEAHEAVVTACGEASETTIAKAAPRVPRALRRVKGAMRGLSRGHVGTGTGPAVAGASVSMRLRAPQETPMAWELALSTPCVHRVRSTMTSGFAQWARGSPRR